MKNHRETQPSSEELQKELAACERVLAVLGPEEALLITRTRGLKDDRARYMNGFEADLSFDRKISAGVRGRVTAIDQELPGLEKRLTEIQPQVRTAATRANEIRGTLSKETNTSVERLISEALLSAPSHQKLLTEKQKLANLQARMEGAKADLQRANEAVSLAISANQDYKAGSELDLRAKALIERGAIPKRGELPDSLCAEVQKAMDAVEVLKRAIDLQEQTLNQLSGDLEGELSKALLPAHAVLVKRIASGFQEAADSTMHLDLIQRAVSRETGRGVPVLNFHRVQAIHDRNQHPFVAWLSEMRRAGFEV